jgi:cytochrome oxidase Cu insertion factor (SCO1/SenC/PrrC family)
MTKSNRDVGDERAATSDRRIAVEPVPTVGRDAAVDPAAARRGRHQFLALAALFFVPLAIAFWIYYGPAGWRPTGGANKGDLIDPARPLPAVALPTAVGTRTSTDFLRGKWTMLYVGDGRCDDRCRKALYLTRQSRVALNKDIDRVQRVFLVTGHCCDREFLAQEHVDLVVAILGGEGSDGDGSDSDGAGLDGVGLASDEVAGLLATFPSYDDLPVAEAGRIYLVDPLGNLLMSYAPTAPDKALLTDLKKLLRLSHIG